MVPKETLVAISKAMIKQSALQLMARKKKINNYITLIQYIVVEKWWQIGGGCDVVMYLLKIYKQMQSCNLMLFQHFMQSIIFNPFCNPNIVL